MRQVQSGRLVDQGTYRSFSPTPLDRPWQIDDMGLIQLLGEASDFFARNRGLYDDNLMRVREHNDLMQWLKFFLVGVVETARNGVTTFDAILKLQRETDTRIATLGSRAAKARKVLDYLYGQPLADAARVGAAAGLSPASTYKLIADPERLGILTETTGGKRGRTYAFKEYLRLFQ